MNESARMARNVVRSLRIAICEYEHRTGKAPAKIFAELDAYYALQLGGPVRLYPEPKVTIVGIPLERIDRSGLGMYLCGDPVPIRRLPDGDLQVVFPDGTKEVVL
jgi:hypothetical protein